MKKIKILLAFLFGLCSVFYAHAQTDNISPARKQAIDSLALEKVRDLSKYISIIGNKKTQYSEANRVMDRAEELFARSITRSEEHTSELQSHVNLVCRLLLEKKK